MAGASLLLGGSATDHEVTDGWRILAAGGNSGIGYESGLNIAQAGGHVILAVRSDDKGEE